MVDLQDPKTQTISAVLADVDGTLVTDDKVLTPRAIRAIEELSEHGVLFAVTSGRPPRGLRMLVDPLGLEGPLAGFNGGVIVRPDMTIVDAHPLPADVTAGVIDAVRAGGLYAWIYTGTDWYITDPEAPRAEREASNVQFKPTVVPSYDGLLDQVVKIVGVSEDHDAVARCEASVQEEFGARVTSLRSRPHYLDTTHPTANKGAVIELLSRYHHIPLQRFATLGDELNDVLMFERSGLSIAMGNASEDVRQQATYFTASNEEDGFAQAIEEYILPLASPAHMIRPAGAG